MPRAFADITFTPSVRAMQAQMGSAKAYEKFLAPEAEAGNLLWENEVEFIAERDGFYQATVAENGWPYVQFRGGPRGFLKVIDEKTIAYADFRGNRQYLSAGNLADNDRVSLILMDYPNRRRLKIWGRARLVSITDDPVLVGKLHDPDYRGKPERAVVIAVEAFDWNCPQHIPQRMTLEEFRPQLQFASDEIARLSAENEALRKELKQEV